MCQADAVAVERACWGDLEQQRAAAGGSISPLHLLFTSSPRCEDVTFGTVKMTSNKHQLLAAATSRGSSGAVRTRYEAFPFASTEGGFTVARLNSNSVSCIEERMRVFAQQCGRGGYVNLWPGLD